MEVESISCNVQHSKAIVSLKYSGSGKLISAASSCNLSISHEFDCIFSRLGADRKCSIMRTEDGSFMCSLESGDVNALGLNDTAWVDQESHVVTAGDDKCVRLWNLENV